MLGKRELYFWKLLSDCFPPFSYTSPGHEWIFSEAIHLPHMHCLTQCQTSGWCLAGHACDSSLFAAPTVLAILLLRRTAASGQKVRKTTRLSGLQAAQKINRCRLIFSSCCRRNKNRKCTNRYMCISIYIISTMCRGVLPSYARRYSFL